MEGKNKDNGPEIQEIEIFVTKGSRKRKGKNKKSLNWFKFTSSILWCAVFLLGIVLIWQAWGRSRVNLGSILPLSTEESIEETVETTSEEELARIAAELAAEERADIILRANTKALQYDYEGAIEILNTAEDVENDAEITELINEYQTAISSLVAVSPYNVTHIFFHSLVVDTSRGFSIREGNSGWNNATEGYCEWMTTVDEFNRIMEQMYERGYVLISMYDMVEETIDEEGVVHMTPKDILLPEGKIPFVLSLDDLSYYHSYDGRGIASKMIIGEDGKPTCEYIDADGNLLVGSYDCVPLLDDFVEAHPDFSYKGAKGTIALTGYNGILGYRTDYSYRDRVNLGSDQELWLNAHPDFDWEAECANAKQVADAIKANGWTFASHTWGHMHIGDASMTRVQADTEKWLNYVEPLVGETDIIIFAHGQDLATWQEEYTSTEKFKYLKSQGFNIFCTVDSASEYTVKFHDLYMKQGRRNLDGYRLWQSVFGNNDKTSDLYDAASVWDQTRPTDPELYDLK